MPNHRLGVPRGGYRRRRSRARRVCQGRLTWPPLARGLAIPRMLGEKRRRAKNTDVLEGVKPEQRPIAGDDVRGPALDRALEHPVVIRIRAGSELRGGPPVSTASRVDARDHVAAAPARKSARRALPGAPPGAAWTSRAETCHWWSRPRGALSGGPPNTSADTKMFVSKTTRITGCRS